MTDITEQPASRRTLPLSSSFRDPAGFLFRRDGVLLRQVNNNYTSNYDLCERTGLFESLINAGFLIPHEEVDDPGLSNDLYRVIKPDEVPYVSYPYEWSFSQIKDAALLTLSIQSVALDHGLALKDASAYNVQYVGGKPVFIDTLSFDEYREGEPWIAYRQFCQHFLAPLVLMAKSDLRLRHLTASFIDGIPLDLVSSILPRTSYLDYSTFAHIHMHAKSQIKHQSSADASPATQSKKLSKTMLTALIASLRSAVEKLDVGKVETEWGDYYESTNYSDAAMTEKERLVADFVERYLSNERVVHDLGANTGRFSRVAAKFVDTVVAHDIDEMAVESHYNEVKMANVANVLPLLLDLSNPSTNLGWDITERASFHVRAHHSSAIALALIHHLCISNNVPLQKLASFFSGIFRKLIIEFVPKSDSQVKRLLATRADIFGEYDEQHFELAFSQYFDINEKRIIPGTTRTLYAMSQRAR